nr:LCP family protein [Microlunatus panaciterrae]
MASVFAGGGDKHAKDGRINVLLLGGDAGKTRVGLRPDSLTVASIDAETGRTVLLSLPRNMEDVPFPAYSPLHKVFPKGYTCADHSCMLNAVYTYASEHKDLYPGVKDPGVQATKEAVEGVTGLKVNYYAMIDLKGFQSLIDAVGGITLDINKRIPIGGGSTEVKHYIEPGKGVKLDGFHALWFARSRHDSSDYERMVRQKCVMNAMLNQLDPMTVLTKFNQIAAAGKEIVETDVPSSEISTLMDLALKARQLPVSSVAFVPPLVYPGNPKFDVVRATVQKKIVQSEAADSGEPTTQPKAKPAGATSAPSGSADSTPATKPTKKSAESTASDAPYSGSETSDLENVCHAS